MPATIAVANLRWVIEKNRKAIDLPDDETRFHGYTLPAEAGTPYYTEAASADVVKLRPAGGEVFQLGLVLPGQLFAQLRRERAIVLGRIEDVPD